MLRAVSVKAKGAWQGEAADILMLDHTQRAARNITVTGLNGHEVNLAFEDRVTLRSNDAVIAETGEVIEIIGKPETLLEIRPASEADFARIAWQLGTQQQKMQIAGNRIRVLANDAIAAAMLGMGARVMKIEAPFDPEGGTYLAPAEVHHHGEGCGCGHHDHETGGHHHHDHGHAPASAHSHEHKHGAGCCGGHSHDHGHHDHGHAHDHAHGSGCCGGHGHKHD